MKVIEFLGMSRAGKSTQQKKVLELLEQRGYSCAPFVRPKFSFKEAGTAERFHTLFFEHMGDAYKKGIEQRLDYLVYDRGFHDRIAMLVKDSLAGRVSSQFKDSFEGELIEYAEKVDFPVLFLVSPETSFARWGAQIREGMDNSALTAGLGPKEDVNILREEYKLYTSLRQRFTYLPEIDAEAQKEEVTHNLFHMLGLNRASILNKQIQLTPCTK